MGTIKRFLHTLCDMVESGSAPILTKSIVEKGNIDGKEIVFISDNGNGNLLCGDFGFAVLGRLLHKSEFSEYLKTHKCEKLLRVLWRVEYLVLDKDDNPLDLIIATHDNGENILSIDSFSSVYYADSKDVICHE